MDFLTSVTGIRAGGSKPRAQTGMCASLASYPPRSHNLERGRPRPRERGTAARSLLLQGKRYRGSRLL